jgi:hypothetical protein
MLAGTVLSWIVALVAGDLSAHSYFLQFGPVLGLLAATLRDLEANRPGWVMDTAPADIHHWSRVPLEKFPSLRAYIDAHYSEVASPAGARVYRRRDG